MQVIRRSSQMQKIMADLKIAGKKIGFVPTMGALHAGHMSLVKKSKRENDITVVSIFVNPTQFGQNEDLAKYPRPFAKDKELLEKTGVNYLFYPTVEQMYPDGFGTAVTVKGLNKILEGESRPGHFDGVATVVLKLFEIIGPTKAYFGQKDFQQCVVVRKMIVDLNLPVNFKMCPTVRERSGLAMSSRNVYLSAKEKEQALVINKSLRLAVDLIKNGNKSANNVVAEMKKSIGNNVRIDYITIRKPADLAEVNRIDSSVVILFAGYVGKTRLIDNALIGYN